MSKELEALIRLYEHLDAEDLTGDEYYINDADKDFDSIETALKNYEYQTKIFEKLIEPKISVLTDDEIEQFKKSSGYTIEYNGRYIDENTFKKLKAFEIIKEKRVDITTLLDCRNAKEYNRWVGVRSHYTYRPFEITQEEYDLLKEVLS